MAIEIACDHIGMRELKAAIWQNISEKRSFFQTTFSWPIKDQSRG